MSMILQKLREYADRLKSERERIKCEVEKDDFLLRQIDEFREKAKQLQELLSSKENKVQELQEIVSEREGKAKELSDIIEEHQDAAERVVAGVKEQIDGMIEAVDFKLNELQQMFSEQLDQNAKNSEEQGDRAIAHIREFHEHSEQSIREFVEKTEEALRSLSEKVETSLSGLDGQFESVKSELSEKVHTEDVKCYRNIQALIAESDNKLDSLQEHVAKVSSVKTWIRLGVFVGALNLACLIGLIIAIL